MGQPLSMTDRISVTAGVCLTLLSKAQTVCHKSLPRQLNSICVLIVVDYMAVGQDNYTQLRVGDNNYGDSITLTACNESLRGYSDYHEGVPHWPH